MEDLFDEIRYQNFLQVHKSQLVSSAVPEHFWKTLFCKLTAQKFDAHETFNLLRFELEDEDASNSELQSILKVFVICENGVKKDDSKHIYLIDHAWTYTPQEAKSHLLKVPGLLDRMFNLMELSQTSKNDNQIEMVFNTMWKYNNTYSISSNTNVEGRLPVWYILDEFGSSIQHSDDPSFRVLPFAFASEGVTYSILFPIKDVEQDEEVTRDFVEGINNDLVRKSMLLPWFPLDLSSKSFLQSEPVESYFKNGHLTETLPDLDFLSSNKAVPNNVLKVYSDYEFINKYLTDKRFQIVTNDNEADILWYTNHFTEFNMLSLKSPQKYINQFPYEFVITIKDLLGVVCRRSCKSEKKYNEDTLELFPLWLPETYNLNTELPLFVSYFQSRGKKNLDNHWICKPWNLARGLDTHITNNLDYIVRLPNSGPKIAQKYLNTPVLFHREDITGGSGMVKFDIRYVLLLKSVRPLDAYVYKNFFLRFANKSFEMNDFDDYEKHFTVMNYDDNMPLHRMLCDEFIRQFEIQYPSIEWSNIEQKLLQMFKEMFEAAVEKEPPCGIGHNPQSRALYAADVMLSYSPHDISIEPKLLEVNWLPDCERACLYYNDFYNDIFSLLFLNEERDVFYKL